jgi:hypothetical protein
MNDPRHQSDEAGVPREHLVCIAAAVAAVLGERARVAGVTLVHDDPWLKQGRREVMGSHHPGPRRGWNNRGGEGRRSR